MHFTILFWRVLCFAGSFFLFMLIFLGGGEGCPVMFEHANVVSVGYKSFFCFLFFYYSTISAFCIRYALES